MSDILDTSDLQVELDNYETEYDNHNDGDHDETPMFDCPLCEGNDADRERYHALKELRDEVGSEWKYGVTLIPESEWFDYAQQTAYDVGMIEEGSPMENYVDWERWAEAMQMDYTSYEFDGYTYYGRA